MKKFCLLLVSLFIVGCGRGDSSYCVSNCGYSQNDCFRKTHDKENECIESYRICVKTCGHMKEE